MLANANRQAGRSLGALRCVRSTSTKVDVPLDSVERVPFNQTPIMHKRDLVSHLDLEHAVKDSTAVLARDRRWPQETLRNMRRVRLRRTAALKAPGADYGREP